jgi:hypothetical protein
MRALSDHVRKLGMGFGIWHMIAVRNGGGAAFDFAKAEDRQVAIDTIRRWVKDWNITWIRWEAPGQGDFHYWQGYNEVIDAVSREFPELHIECCYSGGTRFDLAQARRTVSTWLSDHTADADVCRFMQTGALRFWPSHFLNLAVRVHRNTADAEATAYNVISRMPGALSFNGDVAQWSPEATARVRSLVDAYKSVRHLQSQPTLFPLPQPRSSRDWDVVVYGDGREHDSLLYAFRMDGPEEMFVPIPGDQGGRWQPVTSSGPAEIKDVKGGVSIKLDRNGASIWRRVR